jgi:glycogen synthase
LIVGMGGVTEPFRNWPERTLGRALVERGHTVSNVAYYDPSHPALRRMHETIDGITVRRAPIRHAPNHLLRRALNQVGPVDIMHLFHPRNVFAYGATCWAQRRGIPTVYTWNGPFHDRYLIDDRERPYDERPKYERLIWSRAEVWRRSLRDGRLRDHLRNYWLHWPLRQARALLPCSRHEGTILREMSLTQPITPIPQWIETDALTGTTPAGPRGANGVPVLLFIGQLTPRKGYDLLVKALPRVIERHPATRVQIVSGLNPADRAAMEQMAREQGVAGQIEFLGRVEDARLVELFRAATVYVTPTRYEGFGLTLLEAMATGCPVITTNIPVVDEIVRHGENGWLTPYDDPAGLAEGIIRLLDDPDLRQRLAAAGEQTVRERFDGSKLVLAFEQVYQDVIAGR